VEEEKEEEEEEEEEEQQQQEKVSNLCHCSEKLTIAIDGLVCTHTPGTSHSQESVGYVETVIQPHKVHLLDHGNDLSSLIIKSITRQSVGNYSSPGGYGRF